MKAQKTKPTKKSTAPARPYNRYNVYFILERERIVLSKGGASRWTKTVSPASTDVDESSPSSVAMKYYANLSLPSLPSRFCHLNPPQGWCVPIKDPGARRKHRKSHGVATFRELAQSIATSWKVIDDETMAYCSAVEKALKERHTEMMKDPVFKQTGEPSKPDATANMKQAKQMKPKQTKPKKVVQPRRVTVQKNVVPLPPSTQFKPQPVRQVPRATSSHQFGNVFNSPSPRSAAQTPMPRPPAMPQPQAIRQVSESSSTSGPMTAISAPIPPPLPLSQLFGNVHASQHSFAPNVFVSSASAAGSSSASDVWAPLPLAAASSQASDLPPPPAIISEFFGNNFFDVHASAHQAPAPQPERIAPPSAEVDPFASVVQSIEAPSQPSCQWKWASDDVAADRSGDANISDDEIRWMWNLQH